MHVLLYNVLYCGHVYIILYNGIELQARMLWLCNLVYHFLNIQDVGHVLKQMSVCLDKEFKPIPCPEAGSEMSDCGDFLYVPFDSRYTR